MLKRMRWLLQFCRWVASPVKFRSCYCGSLGKQKRKDHCIRCFVFSVKFLMFDYSRILVVCKNVSTPWHHEQGMLDRYKISFRVRTVKLKLIATTQENARNSTRHGSTHGSGTKEGGSQSTQNTLLIHLLFKEAAWSCKQQMSQEGSQEWDCSKKTQQPAHAPRHMLHDYINITNSTTTEVNHKVFLPLTRSSKTYVLVWQPYF